MDKCKIRNFCSGPAHLPDTVIEQAVEGLNSFQNSGLSILEIYHRDKRYLELLEEGKSLLNELCELRNEYHILFLSGGATSLFGSIPANLLMPHASAAFINTGRWAAMAAEEASLYGLTEEWGSSKADNYTYIPPLKVPASSKATYLHITTNNTVVGTQYSSIPKVNLPLVADMSSDILSCPRDYHQFDIAYAGAQKNLGTAGVCLVLIKKTLAGYPVRDLPRMLDLKKHVEAESNLNTPPVFPIYICVLMLRWIKQQGLESLFKTNGDKADTLYKEIDRNPLFSGHAQEDSRSQMNVTFRGVSDELEGEFLSVCDKHGFRQIKGHRSIGGLRVALYNAIPLEWVQDLTELMKHFEKEKG
jgi:phosphoserine aminotransferase